MNKSKELRQRTIILSSSKWDVKKRRASKEFTDSVQTMDKNCLKFFDRFRASKLKVQGMFNLKLIHHV